jgi:hypothetical protein
MTDSTEDWPGRAIDMGELGRRIAARRAELNLPHPAHPEHVEGLRNAGANRTESKRALLKGDQGCGRGVVN